MKSATCVGILCAMMALTMTEAKFPLSLPNPKQLIEQKWEYKWEYHYESNITFNETFEEMMEELDFFTKSLYAGYNGFIRGFYREHARTVVDDRCMGEWVTQNMTYLGHVWVKIWNLEFL